MHDSGTVHGTGVAWYVVQHGAAERRLFPRPHLYRELRSLLRTRLAEQHGRLLGYCMLQSQLHWLLVLRLDEHPRRLIQSVAHVYAARVNRLQGHRGHLFGARYRATEIPTAAELRATVVRLARLPTEHGAARTPAMYRHASYRCYLGLDPANGTDVSTVLRLFGPTVPSARTALKEAVRTYQESLAPPPRPGRSARARRGRELLTLGGSLDGTVALLERFVVAELELPSVDVLRVSSERRAAEGRALVSLLATAHGLASIAQLARRYQRDLSTLSVQRKRYAPRHRALLALPAAVLVERIAGELAATSDASRPGGAQ